MNCLVTLAVGHQRFWRYTHVIMKEYARKHGLDFVVIDAAKINAPIEHSYKLEKFQIAELLNTYDRVLYLDGDIVIHPDCPNLFTLTPPEKIGAVAESPPHFQRDGLMEEACRLYGFPEPSPGRDWINNGMLVVSQGHKKLFELPERVVNFPVRNSFGVVIDGHFWLDMPLMNALIAKHDLDIIDLGYRYNYLGSLQDNPKRAFPSDDAMIFHGSGAHKRDIYRLIVKWYGGLISLDKRAQERFAA